MRPWAVFCQLAALLLPSSLVCGCLEHTLAAARWQEGLGLVWCFQRVGARCHTWTAVKLSRKSHCPLQKPSAFGSAFWKGRQLILSALLMQSFLVCIKCVLTQSPESLRFFNIPGPITKVKERGIFSLNADF